MASKRAAIYARVSTEDQKTYGGSLETQEEIGRKVLEAMGFEVVKVYSEDYTGKVGIPERPALTIAYNAAKRGHFDLLWCYSDDRLAREHNVLLDTIKKFREVEVEVKLQNMTIGDLDDADAWLQIMIKATISEWERRKIVQRTSEGRKAAKKKGIRFGRTPLFFRVTDNGTLEPTPEAYEIQRQRQQGESRDEVAKRYGIHPRQVTRTLRILRDWREREEDWKLSPRTRRKVAA